MDPLHSLIEQQHNFYCLTVPIINPCHIKDAFTRREYTRNTAHLQYPDHELDSLNKERCKLLGVTFLIDELDDLAEKMLDTTNALQPVNDSGLSLITPAGAYLVEKLTHACGEITRGSADLNSELSTRELEDDLITALLLAMEENRPGYQKQKSCKVEKAQIAHVEDYMFANLINPVSRARLAEIAGVSVRSLSRAFVKRHGVGPMRFLKERRMEAVRMELINASPENTKISDVALQYGFTELGKFSLLYKSVYNEKPSETLKH